MVSFKEIPFAFEGADYQIRVLYQDRLVNVVAFQYNYPANGFRRHIQVSKELSVKELLERDVMDELVEECKRDITERRWERLLGSASEQGDRRD